MNDRVRAFFGSERTALPAVILLFLALGFSSLTSLLPPDGDDASYVLLAESLAKGLGYVNTIYPGDPPETQYPPLLPVLLAPFVGLFGRSFLVLKLVPLAFGAGSLVAIYKLFKRRGGHDRALFVTALTALNATYLNLASSILTETTYLFLSMVALLVIDRTADSEGGLKGALAGAVLIAASFYARTVGATLAAGVVVFLVLRGRLKAAFVISGVLLVLLAWWGWRSIEMSNSYFYQLLGQGLEGPRGEGLSLWISRVERNLPRYAGKVIADLFGGPAVARMDPYHPVKVAASLIASAVFCVGYAADLRRGITVERLYLLIYLGLFAVWPYHDARFLLPVLPFLIFHGVSGARIVASPWPGALSRARVPIAAVLLGGALAGCLVLVNHNRTCYYYPETAHYREACLWIRSNVPADALVLCRRPREAAVWSERKSFWYPGIPDPQTFEASVRKLNASHVMVNDYPIMGVNLAEQFSEILRRYPHDFRLIFETPPPRTLVYAVRTVR